MVIVMTPQVLIRELQPETLHLAPTDSTTLDRPVSQEAQQVEAAVILQELRKRPAR